MLLRCFCLCFLLRNIWLNFNLDAFACVLNAQNFFVKKNDKKNCPDTLNIYTTNSI